MRTPKKSSDEVSRRSILASATLVPLAAASGIAQIAGSNFSRTQSEILEAFLDRLVPSDESGPGALECGVATYIDRSFSGDLAGEKAAFLAGLAAVDALARSRHGMPFAELPAHQKDEAITAMENNTAPGFSPNSRVFFLRIRQLTLEGMFSDPFYGGNRGFRGWDLIRYPGPRMAVSSAEQAMRDPIKPLRSSSYGGKRAH